MVRWFANAILILEQTTEEGADSSAAESLIGAAFRWSPRRAFRLFKWFLAEQMVPFDDALISLLHAALVARQAPLSLVASVVAEVVIPVSMDGPPPRLIKRLLAIAMEQGGKASALDTARLLTTRAATRALPSVRNDWGRAIAQALEPLGIELAEVGMDTLLADPHDQPTALVPSPLKLRDGSERDANVVAAETQSVSRIVELLGQEASSSYFDWWPVINRVAALAPTVNVAELAATFRDRRGSERVQNYLGGILLERGENGLAKDVLISALETSGGLGWDRRWGGGNNLDVARRLVELDRVWARPVLFDRLITYLTDEPGRYGQIARNLREIVSVLDDHPPMAKIWSEVENFVRSLFAAHDMSRVDFDWLSEPVTTDGVDEGLADVVTMLLTHPTLLIAQATQRICALGILGENIAMRLVVKSALQGSTDLVLPVLQLVHAASLENPKAIFSLRPYIEELTDSPDFSIRSISRDICVDLGWESRAVKHISRPISYALELPLGPIHTLRPFENHLLMLADLTGLPEASIAWRVTNFMDQMAEPNSWSSTAEKRLSAAIHNVHIRLPYRRPRVQVARSALFRVVGELVDAGDLDGQNLARLSSWLRIHDPAMVLLNPSERPQWLQPMEEPGYGQDNESEWLSKVGQAKDSQIANLDGSGLALLAMRAEFRQTTQRYPSERRRFSVEGVERRQAGRNSHRGIGHVSGLALAEYPALKWEAHPLPIVIENAERNAYDTPAPNWLALNPTLGRDLGWHPAHDEALPKWVDTNGDTMVWSVWWTDGIVDTNWTVASNVVGEGWLVLASASALAALRDRYDSLQYRAFYRRSLDAGEDQAALERTYERVEQITFAEPS